MAFSCSGSDLGLVERYMQLGLVLSSRTGPTEALRTLTDTGIPTCWESNVRWLFPRCVMEHLVFSHTVVWHFLLSNRNVLLPGSSVLRLALHDSSVTKTLLLSHCCSMALDVTRGP